jgi:hypothetical protein
MSWSLNKQIDYVIDYARVTHAALASDIDKKGFEVIQKNAKDG